MIFRPRLLASVLALIAPVALALTIQSPPPGSVNPVSPGDDFSSVMIADAWDMTDSTDLGLSKSFSLVDQSIAGGIYSGTTTSQLPAVFPLYPGITSSVPTHNGARFPIDTQRFRFLTVKVRAYNPSGPNPGPGHSLVQAFFYRDQDALVNMEIGCSNPAYYTAGLDWQIVTIDMQQSGSCVPAMPWTSGTVQGLRIDPVREAGVNVELDWIRLTSATGGPNQRFLVTWSDTVTGASYTITALDVDNTRFVLGQGIQALQLNADFSRLAPGDYRIEVTRAGAAATSTGVVRIASPATVKVTNPSSRGDTSRSYAHTVIGNPWGPIDPSDFRIIVGLANLNYNTPPGTLTARPTSNDPSLFMQTASTPINTSLYRSACFTMEIFGQQDVGTGSVARWLWGNTHPTLTASDDIIIEEGVNEYCLEDMAQVPIEGPNQTPWLANNVIFFRLDPHEFPVSAQCTSSPSPENCRDIRLHSVTLSPFSTATPALQVAWTHRDDDSANHTVRVILDQNRIAGDGPEYLVATANRAPGTHTLNATIPPGVPAGKYYVAVEVLDANASTRSYSTGPVLAEPAGDLIFANGFQ